MPTTVVFLGIVDFHVGRGDTAAGSTEVRDFGVQAVGCIRLYLLSRCMPVLFIYVYLHAMIIGMNTVCVFFSSLLQITLCLSLITVYVFYLSFLLFCCYYCLLLLFFFLAATLVWLYIDKSIFLQQALLLSFRGFYMVANYVRLINYQFCISAG